MNDTTFADVVTTPTPMLDMIKQGQIDANKNPSKFFPLFDFDVNEAMHFASLVQEIMCEISDDFAEEETNATLLLPFVVMDDVILFHPNLERNYLATSQAYFQDFNVDGVLLGLVATLFALNRLCIHHFHRNNSKWNEFYGNKYHALRNWFYGNIDQITENENSTPEQVETARRASHAFFNLTD